MLKQRIVTALILAAGFLSALFLLPEPYWSALIGVVAALAAWEWGGLAGLKHPGRIAFAVLIVTLGWLPILFAYVYADDELVAYMRASALVCNLVIAVAALFWLILAPCWLLRRWRLKDSPTGKVALLLLGALLIFATWAAFVFLRQRFGPAMLLAILAVAWISDIAAYFTGRKFGGAKLAPAISPGKTWSGAYGGIIAVALYSFCGILIFGVAVAPAHAPNYGLLLIVATANALFALLLAVTGILGDLFESLLKRQADIKDSSQILPGHGGVLDRIDSLMAILPSAVFLYTAYQAFVAP